MQKEKKKLVGGKTQNNQNHRRRKNNPYKGTRTHIQATHRPETRTERDRTLLPQRTSMDG
jgi:hypothetical protein